jgi:Pathogenicity locus
VIDATECAKMQLVPLCGPRVVARLEAIGVRRLVELRGEDPFDLMERVNSSAGHPIWHPPMATRALENLIAAAEHEAHGG